MTVKFNFEIPAETSSIFTDEANQFVESLHNKFSAKISELLQARASRQEDFNNGKLPDFLPSTKEVRSADWKVRDIPLELLDRRVEITGPVDRESVKDYYSTSNLMILPSISEGLARVIFESQVAMCPVLVTDAPGMSDIVIDGQTGYVFESNNLDSLSLKIEYIKNNYEEASLVAKNAKGFILSNYSEDNFKFSFKKLFDTV